jgi:hypothetical protein
MTDAETNEPQPPAPEEPQMEIHKPKPVHNWREFLTELGTIVLGICIALAGEQAIEWSNWKSQVRDAREVIAAEMASNLEGAIRRMRTVRCTEQRLDTLAKILDQASRSGSLQPVGYIGAPPPHRWLSGAWDSVVASQTATHFPRQQLADLSNIYKMVEREQENSIEEVAAWSDLSAVVGPGRRLDPASEAQLRSALSRARIIGRNMAANSMFMVAGVRRMNLPFNRDELDGITEVRTQSLTDDKPTAARPGILSAICGPIGAVPPNYGEAQTRQIPAMVDAAAKSLPDFGSAAP